MRSPTVSVVIPCFNHGRFLGEAIRSVCDQTYQDVEIIVIDDGSEDDTRSVANGIPNVQYIYQRNSGLASARNHGIRASTGRYLAFLDADDVLTQNAVEASVKHLTARPSCAFVSGDYLLVGPTLETLPKAAAPCIESDPYLALLRSNYIGMHAAVMYRRQALEEIGGFDETLKACEDYDVYLRIARRRLVSWHRTVVAKYRQHDNNMSADPALMLHWALKVHDAELPYVKGNPDRESAFQDGDAYLREYYGNQMIAQVLASRHRPDSRSSAMRTLACLVRHYPMRTVARRTVREIAGSLYRGIVPREEPSSRSHRLPKIEYGQFRTLKPVSEAGDSILQHQAIALLSTVENDIRGDILRVDRAEHTFTFVYSQSACSYDTVICNLVLQYEYDLRGALSALKRVLRTSGVLVAVLPGVTIPSHEGTTTDYWRFTGHSARKLFECEFEASQISVKMIGTALTSMASLHRIPASSLSETELLASDIQFQSAILVRAKK